MSKPCLNLTLLPLFEAVQSLVALLEPRLPLKLLHPHEKISDAVLVALEVLRVLHKHPYRSVWFTLVLLNFYPDLPSYTQIYTRLERLGDLIETWHQTPESVDIAVVDSFPLPVCRPKRAHGCKVRFASLGYGTQGSVYGFKGHVWTTPQGRVLQYRLESAHHHDSPIARKLNTHWAAFGAPQVIGDKAHVSDTIATPPKADRPDRCRSVQEKNATRASKWKAEYGPLRVGIERTFSWIVRTGVRNSQIKTFKALRSRVAYAVLAHTIRLFNP